MGCRFWQKKLCLAKGSSVLPDEEVGQGIYGDYDIKDRRLHERSPADSCPQFEIKLVPELTSGRNCEPDMLGSDPEIRTGHLVTW